MGHLLWDGPYLANARAELQSTADSAAMAACWEYAEQIAANQAQSTAVAAAKTEAINMALENKVTKNGTTVFDADITVGYISDFANRTAALDTSTPSLFNAVHVVTQKTESQNGRVPFFFARVFGMDGTDAFASATAAFVVNIGGFQTPGDGSNIDLLPFALDEDTWNDMLAGNADDEWTWNRTTGNVECGSDGMLEVNLYPQDTGSPGNRGTVDIGSSNNSTSDIARQIVDGVSPDDLDHHGGVLGFDSNGEMVLNGDTGISAGVKDELASIIGDARIVPIFRTVQGPGNNAMYTIVKFAGIRILEVKLTGSKKSKRVIVQPAPIATQGVIPSPSTQTSDYVYSNVFLTQ